MRLLLFLHLDSVEYWQLVLINVKFTKSSVVLHQIMTTFFMPVKIRYCFEFQCLHCTRKATQHISMNSLRCYIAHINEFIEMLLQHIPMNSLRCYYNIYQWIHWYVITIYTNEFTEMLLQHINEFIDICVVVSYYFDKIECQYDKINL